MRWGGGGGTNTDSVLGGGTKHFFLLILYNFKSIGGRSLRFYPHFFMFISVFDLSVICTPNGKTAEPEYYRRAAKAEERKGGGNYFQVMAWSS